MRIGNQRRARRQAVEAKPAPSPDSSKEANVLAQAEVLRDHEVAALLFLVIEAQLGLAGDERAAGVASLMAAGWTGRLARMVGEAVESGSLGASPNLKMISDGLAKLDAIAVGGGFTESVTLSFGGADQIRERAAQFDRLCQRDRRENEVGTSTAEDEVGAEPGVDRLCQTLTHTLPSPGSHISTLST